MDPSDLRNVTVLLVDDDVDWLELNESLLERHDDSMEIRTAAGGWEALDVLDGTDVDCVVCDYRMPNMDGIAVLERVRAKGMDLPFIIVTSEGDETVASRAISSKVTDYFVKDPGRDQSSNLAARIRSAVASHRTRKELAAARRKFTGLFENVPDPVAVVDADGGIDRINDAFERTFDVREASVRGTGVDACLDGDLGGVPSGDRTAVRNLTLSTAEGPKDFLVRRFSLTEDGSALGYVFTDVTEQRDRQRDLRRALSLDAEVRELLLSASTRGDLERSFCETVAAPEGRLLAVIAGSDARGTPRVRAAAGEASDRVEEVVGDGDGPLGAAIRESTSQYVPSTEDLDEEWAERLLDAGVHSVLAVPVERNGVAEGAFAIYDRRTAAFDGDRGARLEGLVSSLGDAVGLVERMGALSADRVLRVRVSVDGGGPLARAARDVDTDFEVTAATRTDEGTALYVDVTDGDGAVPEHLLERDPVENVETVIDDAPTRLRAETGGETLPGVVVDRGASIHSLTVSDAGDYEVTLDVPPSGDIEAIVEAIDDRFGTVTVHSIRNHEPEREDGPVEGPLSGLTQRQRDALEAAYYEGYYERPRKNSSEAVAETLSISSSTFLEHLREAEQRLLTSVFRGDRSDGDDA